MKAIVWQGENNFRTEEVPKPKAGPGQILVKIQATAVCTSDFHLADFGAQPPLIPGHEAAGIVDEISDGVTAVHVGDRVTLNPVMSCGRCYCCTRGMEHLCLQFRHLGFADTQGTWAEYVAVDAVNAHQLPDHVDFVAGSVIEPAAVGYESFERAQLRKGDNVLIIGDGPFGFCHAMIAQARGADKIVVAGHYDSRLRRIADQTGALICNTHRESLEDILSSVLNAPGMDIVVEATGSTSAPNIGLKCLRPRGTLVLFSYVWKPEPMEMGLIHMKELNVLGSCRSLKCFEPCLDLIRNKAIQLRPLVDQEFSIEAPEQARIFLREHKKEAFKIVFRFDR